MPAPLKVFAKLFVLSVLLLLITPALAQRQNNIWYFGAFAGLNFNQTPVAALTNGKLNASEACASIADEAGNLLFYTDGITVWNKEHNIMQNGFGLAGDPQRSSTQLIIVPKPDNDQEFLVFTMSAFGGELYYSTVNMSGDGGRGAVTDKNILMLDHSTEKLVAIRHANGKDIWIVGHEAKSYKYVFWLLTAGTFSPTPDHTELVGRTHKSAIGYLRASPDGNTLVCASEDDAGGFVEYYPFNRATGLVSAAQALSGFTAGSIPYGLEFSPNGQLLYISEYLLNQPAKLYQVKMPFTSGNVNDKGTVLANLPAIAALQMAPDGKIYLSQVDKASLHTINSPNTEGVGADFQLNAVSLAGKKSKLGLPPANLSNFLGLTFVSTGNCSGVAVEFEMIANTASVSNINWDFGDPASGAANISNNRDPSHIFSAEGTYSVTVNAIVEGALYTKTKQVVILRSPNGALHDVEADKTILCEPGKVNISAQGATGSEVYKWYDENGAFITETSGQFETPVVSANTSYYVSISNGICEGEKQRVDIVYDPAVAEITASNTVINLGESVTLTANEATTWSWSPATYLDATNSKTVVSTPLNNITYTLTTTNANGCPQEATVNIIVKSEIKIPNAFSPNADGVNDFWVIKNIEYTDNFTQIFDRNGMLVYQARNYKNNWGGTLNGKALPTGVYYYIIKLANNTVKSGNVSIIR